MNEDEKSVIYHKGFIKGREHNKPLDNTDDENWSPNYEDGGTPIEQYLRPEIYNRLTEREKRLLEKGHDRPSTETKMSLNRLSNDAKLSRVILSEIKNISIDNKKEIKFIKVQTTKTNGRVTLLEVGHGENGKWRSKVMGIFIASSTLVPIITGLIVYIFLNGVKAEQENFKEDHDQITQIVGEMKQIKCDLYYEDSDDCIL